jgi:hypothetical protein
MEISWLWIPGESVGPFRFGEEAEGVLVSYKLVKLEPDCQGASWDTYEIPAYKTKLYVEDGRIINVLCEDELYYRGVNLIGLSLEETRAFLGPEDEYVQKISLGDAAYYHRLGLTLWIVDGIIDTATCEPAFASGPLQANMKK